MVASEENVESRYKYLYLITICLIYFLVNIYSLRYNNDLSRAFPLIKQLYLPGLFPDSDILVKYGIRGPFYFYKFTSYILPGIDNLYRLYSIITILLIPLSVYSFFVLASSILKSERKSILATLLFFSSGSYFAILNSMTSPMIYPVSSGCALWISFLGLSFIFKNNFMLSAIVGGLLFYLHPGQAIFVCILSFLFYIRSGQNLKGLFTKVILPPLLISIPFFIKYIQGTYSVVGLDVPNLINLWDLWQYHVRIEDHILQSYYSVFFLIAFNNVFQKEQYENVQFALKIFFGLIIFYIINVYFLKVFSLSQMYLFRASIFIKPLVVIILTENILLLLNKFKNGDIKSRSYIFFIILSVAYLLLYGHTHKEWFTLLAFFAFFTLLKVEKFNAGESIINILVKFSIILSLFVFYLWKSINVDFYTLFIQHYSKMLIMIFCVAFYVSFIFIKPTYRKNIDKMFQLTNKNIGSFILIFFLLCIPKIKFNRKKKEFFNDLFGISKELSPNKNILDWFVYNKITSKMILIDPLNIDLFKLRNQTNNGLWVHVYDVNQLAYNLIGYSAVHERLSDLGIKRIKWADLSSFSVKRYESTFKEFFKERSFDYMTRNKIDLVVVSNDLVPHIKLKLVKKFNKFSVYEI